MNTLELEAYKAALAREVLNINNQEVLDTIKDIIQRSGNLTNAPYQIGVKEARKQLQVKRKWKSFIMHCNNENTIRLIF